MTNVVSIDTKDGKATINGELFQGYLDEAYGYLDKIAEEEEKFKEVIETVAETTGLKPAIVKKYIKARYEAKTKATKELGEIFTAIDNATSS